MIPQPIERVKPQLLDREWKGCAGWGEKSKKRKESKQVQEVMSFNCKKENGIDGKRVRVKGENVLPNTGTIA